MQSYEIHADYDGKSIIVYQAYQKAIALPALQNKRFVPPFSSENPFWIPICLQAMGGKKGVRRRASLASSTFVAAFVSPHFFC